mgnify:CR=1 FL=1
MTCRLIAHTDKKNIQKVSLLARTRDLGFQIDNLEMVDGIIKKKSKGLSPFIERRAKGSENMFTLIAEVK